jgi:cob(I)alamin adenosyltransferase
LTTSWFLTTIGLVVTGRPSWFEFLRLDADLALSFIEAARIHSDQAKSTHALGSARTALAEIVRCLKEPAAYGLSDDEVVFLEERCTTIESALASTSS